MPDFFDLPPTKFDEEKPGTNEYAILQWCEERLKRGIRFIESQRGYDKIEKALDEVFSYELQSGSSYVPGPKLLSNTKVNLIATTAEDLTAMLTDIRCFWSYKFQNARYVKQQHLANKSAQMWYVNHGIDLRVGDGLRYYTVAGTGVLHVYYSREIDDMMVEAKDPRSVFPIDPLSYHTFEDCKGVILRDARTPDWVKEMYGKTVRPDVGSVGGVFGWLQRLIDGPGERGGPLSKKSTADKTIPGTPVSYVNTMYLKDNRTNKTGKTVRMGPWEGDEPQSTWSYEVKKGEPLFPFRRMIVWAGDVLLYDDTAPYWRAKFPLIKVTLNPWPKSWFGKAPVWDCMPLQDSITSNLRVVDDHNNQVAQPGVSADRNVSKSELAKYNSRMPGVKIRSNSASGKGIQPLPPPPLDASIWQAIEFCKDMIAKIAGTIDIAAMTALAQIPSDDTIDTIMKAMTPRVRLRSRILENVYKELAQHYLYMLFQFDTVTKRVSRFGPDAVTAEDFDFAGGNMIPDDVPDGQPGDIAATEDAMVTDGPRPLYSRAKQLLQSCSAEIDPSSLLNSAAQQEVMKYFLLAKMGYCSVFTLMEKMGITDFTPPGMEIPDDEISRLQLQQQLGIGMIANAQGRKATDAAPPSLEVTGNGPTMATS